MLTFTKLFFGILLLSFATIFTNDALAYTNEVRQSGSNYIWRVNNVDQGSTTNLATAINNCIGTGNRVVDITCGGTLSAQINLQPGITLYCHNVTFNKNHSGYGFFIDGSGPIKIYDMILNNNSNMGIRTSRAGDIYIQNVRIYGGSIGIRIDSHPSRPYEDGRWVYNVHIQDCRFENGSSHGLETYGVDGFKAYGIVARNMGECGVLLNKTVNGTIGTVDAYRCSYGGGYAGLRYANTCSNVTASMLYANECGRGYFVLTGSNNCHLNNCQITNCSNIGIWLENVVNCSVKAGCTNSGVAVTGSGSYANVSSSCGGGGTTYYRLQNRGTGLFLDGMGRTTVGSDVGQYANTTHVNALWTLESAGGNYYKLKNSGTGLYLDGMGRTVNGDACGQWTGGTSYNQQWERISTSGYYQFKNRTTGLFLDGMGRTANGDACGQWANTTHVNSQWSLVATVKSSQENLSGLTDNTVGIYPNPSPDGKFTISLSSLDVNNLKVKVFSSAGKIINSIIIVENSEIKIDLGTGAASGIYFVKIHNGTQVINEKILVQ